MLFVKACKLFCSHIVKVQNIDAAHEYLAIFCRLFETLYSVKHCTANFHMHFHLRECLLDYGPVYAYWCFSFERYNRILGSF